jgi:SAM-dependent methyltransferase
MSETRRTHWQRVYTDKAPTDVSWYQPVPEKPLHLIRETSIARAEPILDVGGGASTLVDHLHADGYTDITVMDISGKALERSRARLGETADVMNWIESDVTAFEPRRRYALWHDRAAFHFLTDATDRDKYIDIVERALKPGGYLVLATFGPEGPEHCSGLEIRRYGIEQLQELFGGGFKLGDYELEQHVTPMGSTQQFLYSWWRARI